MEHQIYRVIRSSTATGIELRLEDFPKIYVKCDFRDEAEEALLDVICAKFGDGEPVLDYIDDPADTKTSEIWALESNQRLTSLNLGDVFPDGCCPRCGAISGKRLESAVRRLSERVQADVAFTKSGRQLTGLFSERMFGVLLDLGLKPGAFAQVRDSSGKMFWELLSEGVDIMEVPVKSRIAYKAGALRCPKCGFVRFGFVHHEQKDIRHFILEKDWLASNKLVRVLGPFDPQPIFSPVARDVVRKQKDLRGFVWARVGLVKQADVETKLKFDLFPKK